MSNNKTLSNISSDDTRLGFALRELDTPPKHPKRIQDYLRENHERNELKHDVKQLKRDMDTAYLWLRVGVTMWVLVLIMQLMLWFAS